MLNIMQNLTVTKILARLGISNAIDFNIAKTSEISVQLLQSFTAEKVIHIIKLNLIHEIE